MSREELRDYVDEQRAQDIIPYHVYSALIDGIDTLEQEPSEDAISRQALLDDLRAEIEQNAYPIIHGVNNHEKGMTLYGIMQIIDKYKAETEDKNE